MNLADNKELVIDSNNDQFYFFTKSYHEMYISAYKMFLDNKSQVWESKIIGMNVMIQNIL